MERKIKQWKDSLLDLSKRNRMINYRETKRSTLTILDPGFSELFNRLAVGEETLTFQRPIDRNSDLRAFSILTLLEALEYPLPAHFGDIKTAGGILERNMTLKNLRAKSKLARDEQGTNILYLSFGFIEWKEKDAADPSWLKSPLLMMPVSLKQESVNAPFSLSRYDDEIEVNPTLDFMFNQNYNVDLPTFELVDESSIDNYMQTIEGIADGSGWRVVREVSLSLLSFLKISMYHDLEAHKARMLDNPVIRAIAGEAGGVHAIPQEIATFDLDKIHPHDSFQVLNADSSQQEAILLSKSGVSFVMQGPPGTGKSQTITNIIAEALADGRKVLFVSEKLAALEVVHRRLKDVQLDDFCLALHSHKANKKEILEDIGRNLSLEKYRLRDAHLAELHELFLDRTFLNDYARELHAEIQPLGESLYAAYGKMAKRENAPYIPLRLSNITGISNRDFNTMLYHAQSLARAVEQNGGRLRDNPWFGSTMRGFSQKDREALLRGTMGLDAGLDGLYADLSGVLSTYSLEGRPSMATVEALEKLAAALESAPVFPASWFEPETRADLMREAQSSKELYRSALSLRSKCAAAFGEGISGVDVDAVLKQVHHDVDTIRGMGQHQGMPAAGIVDRIREIHADAKGALEKVPAIRSSLAEITEILGTTAPDSIQAAAQHGAVARALTAAPQIRREWFEQAVFPQVRQALSDAAAHSASILSRKQAVLCQWEPELFRLDIEQMLGRFKTDYNGVFKRLGGRYRADIKSLKALSKTAGKRLGYEEAIALLQEAKDIHTEMRWFDDNEPLLRRCFGEAFFGLETDWGSIGKGVEAVSLLQALYPLGMAPQPVVEIAVDKPAHMDAYAKLASIAEALSENSIAGISAKAAPYFAPGRAVDALSLADSIAPALASVSEASASVIRALDAVGIHCKSPLGPSELLGALQDVSYFRAAQASLEESDQKNKILFAERFGGLETDWDSILADLSAVHAFFISEWAVAPNEPFAWKVCGNPAAREEFCGSVENLARQKNALRVPWDGFTGLFDTAAGFPDMDLNEAAQRYRACVGGFPSLDKWIDYLSVKDNLCALGLQAFADGVEHGGCPADSITASFERSFYQQWIGEVAEQRPIIQQFRRRIQDEKVERFSDLDAKQLQYAQVRIREKIISSFPSTNRFMKANDELSKLQRELEKKRQFMPLRKLFREIPNILLALKPCLMMSPLSVAYFLEADSYRFDLVIFDEASQIFPQDAIGAIFRGAQVIIAGDTKQLPPTNFFSVNTSNSDGAFDAAAEEEYEDEVHDSILEETAALLPNRTLKWHYRSQHEHLIAFSNQEIYKNSLVTFPSSEEKRRDMGVEFIFVENGVYSQQRNIEEAKRCVELVDEHIRNHPQRTLGVIAFSSKQQQTIASAIAYYREAHPEHEPFFAEGREEEFFVKNLENVQGDERDTIIFSICYAKTQLQKDQGRPMAMRFGPLNYAGGERRLNVAITRAKKNVKLVSSIQSTDIDLARTQSEGARMLRSYIEFAQKGASSLPGAGAAPTDDLVDAVASFLEKAGYRVRKHVGCSKYKVDIAIEHPDRADAFIAGIECDGYAYIGAKTTRDRDHLRRSVLRRMGWRLYRIWAPEWFKNPDAERERLLRFLQDAADAPSPASGASPARADGRLPFEDIAESAGPPSSMGPADENNPYGFAYYVEAVWPDYDPGLYGGRSVDAIRNMVYHVVLTEQPIHRDLLYARMAPAFHVKRATSTVKKSVDKALRGMRELRLDKDNFYTVNGFADHKVRIAKPGDPPRKVNHIAPAELGLAMLSVAGRAYGLDKDGLIAGATRALGYPRKSQQIVSCMEDAFQRLLDSNRITLIDGKVNVVEEK
ncbi:MAG: DUF3320 domain-containing protein [Clostridiales Family XIII bacterium]|nr:DUF3320 domain-containing protein [Clostridiales Family XIII bacterium]